MKSDLAEWVRRFMTCEMNVEERKDFLQALVSQKNLVWELARFKDGRTILLVEALSQVRLSQEFLRYKEALEKMWVVGTNKQYMLMPLDDRKRAEMQKSWEEELYFIYWLVSKFWGQVDVSNRNDLVADIFVEAFGTILALTEKGQYEERGKAGAFFRTIAYRIAKDMRNKKGNNPISPLPIEPSPSPYEKLQEQENLQILKECLNELSLINQAIYQMVRVELLPQKEVAARLGLTYENVRRRLSDLTRQIDNCTKHKLDEK